MSDIPRSERRSLPKFWSMAGVAAVLLTGCGATSDPVTAPTTVLPAGQETGAVVPDDDEASGIEITVVLPQDWPNPIYPGRPELVIEGADGEEHRSPAAGDRISAQLPSAGDYSVGAIIEDGGCFDTAGVANRGNPPVSIVDGDVVELQPTGEICD